MAKLDSFDVYCRCHLAKVRELAQRVRTAIQSIPPTERPEEFSNFPKGACGSSSLILGAVLVDNGHTNFQYVCGERPSPDGTQIVSHAWLADGELIVDITADQFSDAPEAVVVAVTSTWHKSFEIRHTEAADFRDSLGPASLSLAVAYKKCEITWTSTPFALCASLETQSAYWLRPAPPTRAF